MGTTDDRLLAWGWVPRLAADLADLASEGTFAALERRRDAHAARHAERKTGKLYKTIQAEKQRRRDDVE